MRAVITLILSLNLGLFGLVAQAADHGETHFHISTGSGAIESEATAADPATGLGEAQRQVAGVECDITCLYLAPQQGRLISETNPYRHLILRCTRECGSPTGFDPPPPRA